MHVYYHGRDTANNLHMLFQIVYQPKRQIFSCVLSKTIHQDPNPFEDYWTTNNKNDKQLAYESDHINHRKYITSFIYLFDSYKSSLSLCLITVKLKLQHSTQCVKHT
jgi:hypothetical protein